MYILLSMSCPPSATMTAISTSKKRRFVSNQVPAITETEKWSRDEEAFQNPIFVHTYGEEPVQSDIRTQLFQVGMRVRKSVATGYRTRSKLESSCIISPSPSPQNASLTSFATSAAPFQTPKRSWTYATNKKRELRYDSDEDSDAADFSPITPRVLHSDHRVSIPSSFFDINYDFDVMEDDDLDETILHDSSLSQKGVLRRRVNGRMIAVPKSIRQRQKQCETAWNIFDQLPDIPHGTNQTDDCATIKADARGHMMVVARGRKCDDFEDADFLCRREEIDMDCS